MNETNTAPEANDVVTNELGENFVGIMSVYYDKERQDIQFGIPKEFETFAQQDGSYLMRIDSGKLVKFNFQVMNSVNQPREANDVNG